MAYHQCWDCGRTVDEQDLVRQNVRTSFWGYRRVNMCATCAAKWRKIIRVRRLPGAQPVASVSIPTRSPRHQSGGEHLWRTCRVL